MSYVLGLDLGCSSIGWALVDQQNRKILLSGVRVFPEGVDRDKMGGERSKNEDRRIKRSMRRQITRRARRKAQLRVVLEDAGLLPAGDCGEAALFAADPYALRAKGLDHRLDPYEIGRVLVHLNQRRGFKSNRKSGNAKEEKGMLAEISELAREMEKDGARTLGEFLFRRKSLSPDGPPVRLRGRHTRRSMLEHEFNLLWEKQRHFHADVLTDTLRRSVWDDLIAYQRKMYWPASVVGRCELEPKEKRCRRDHPVAQRFRMLQEVNNLRVIDPNTGEMRPLHPPEREKLIAYLSTSKERGFDEIRKHLGLLESQGFNLEFGERKKMLGLSTDNLLSGKKLFGPQWRQLPAGRQDQIISLLLDDGLADEAFRERAKGLCIPPELADELIDLETPPGYASYSLMAMQKLIPHLAEGLPLSGKAGEPDALHAAGYLRPDEQSTPKAKFLPRPPEITNPLVRAALYQVRQVVNAIIREFGGLAAIHIELAREVKGTGEQRRQMTLRMRRNEENRRRVADIIRGETGREPRRDDIVRYILWEQQGRVCIYSGRAISNAQLFGADVDVDHILPYSRSLDDSQLNKVVAFRTENAEKANRTPYEWLAERHPDKYEGVLQRAARLPDEIRNAKRPKFAQRTLELTEFVERQLNDTKYISRKAAEYLRGLGVDVICTKGQRTADLRHYWGLDTVLARDGEATKNRDDHRHHAVDAIAIALTDRPRLQALAAARGARTLPEPWTDFRQMVEGSVNAINVSFRVNRRVGGPLHEETLYGPTQKPWRSAGHTPGNSREATRPWAAKWTESEALFVYRKPLDQLTGPMVSEIRDPVVRSIVEERLRAFGVEPGSKRAIPSAAWKDPLFMPGPNGARIRRVRLLRKDETIVPIRSGHACVKTGSVHHVCIFEIEAKGKPKRMAVFVSMLEAARRICGRQPVIQRTHPEHPAAKFVMSLSRGELVLGTFKGRERLCVYQTGASTQGQLYFAEHRDARKSGDREKFAVMAGTLDARKVTVDPLGRLRWAND